MTDPASSNNQNISADALAKLYSEGITEKNKSEIHNDPALSSLNKLDSSYKDARSSTLDSSTPVKIENPESSSKVSGLWNRLKQAISPKTEYEIDIQQDEENIKSMKQLEEEVDSFGNETLKNRSDTFDKNTASLPERNLSIIDTGKKGVETAFYTTATGVANLFQSAKQKFTELKDIFGGVGSTSHVPVNFKAVASPTELTTTSSRKTSEPTSTPTDETSKVYIKEEFDDEHRTNQRTKHRELVNEVLKEIEEENLQKEPEFLYAEYKKELEDLENQQPQPKFLNEEQEAAFQNKAHDILEKLEKFNGGESAIQEKLKKGEKVDLQARKNEFRALLEEYKGIVEEFI